MQIHNQSPKGHQQQSQKANLTWRSSDELDLGEEDDSEFGLSSASPMLVMAIEVVGREDSTISVSCTSSASEISVRTTEVVERKDSNIFEL